MAVKTTEKKPRRRQVKEKPLCKYLLKGALGILFLPIDNPQHKKTLFYPITENNGLWRVFYLKNRACIIFFLTKPAFLSKKEQFL
ncbi:MAG: hypothetical protein JNM36_19625 [Chitinophagales bacterium]|nr:hypothetical protein [Chitinophagales bacterium]